jgi:O-antigen ligase
MTLKIDRPGLHRKIYLILMMGIAFCIPVYGRLLPPLIVLLVLNWLIEGRYVKTLPLLFSEIPRLKIFSFSILYFFYLIGLIYSQNLDFGLFDLQVKLSLFIFPIVFATTESSLFNKEKVEKILKAFILGCLTGTLILLSHSFYKTFDLHLDNAFYYTRLSWSFHPSYMAMYLTFSVSILTMFLMMKGKVFTGLKKTALILLILYFIVFIILLSSKAGLIGLLTTLVFYSLILLFRYHRRASGLIMLGATILVLYLGLNIFPYAAGRISQANKDLTEQDNLQNTGKYTANRLVIWEASLVIIKDHWLFGVGTGDVKDELYKEYKIRNMIDALVHKMNSHNQYLQTLITLGVIGVLLLISLLVLPAIQAFRKENWIYFTFLLVFGLNIFVESMLEIQQGVIFYAFFNTLLFAQKK